MVASAFLRPRIGKTRSRIAVRRSQRAFVERAGLPTNRSALRALRRLVADTDRERQHRAQSPNPAPSHHGYLLGTFVPSQRSRRWIFRRGRWARRTIVGDPTTERFGGHVAG